MLPPAAWAMQPPSNSVEKLDQLFSISKRASSAADKTEIFAGLY
ncbi:Rz1 family lipoprotein [Xenorhabdus thailandensis]